MIAPIHRTPQPSLPLPSWLAWLPTPQRVIPTLDEADDPPIFQLIWETSRGKEEAYLSNGEFFWSWNVWNSEGVTSSPLLTGSWKASPWTDWLDRLREWGWDQPSWPFQSPVLRAWAQHRGHTDWDHRELQLRTTQLLEVQIYGIFWEALDSLILALITEESGQRKVIYRVT